MTTDELPHLPFFAFRYPACWALDSMGNGTIDVGFRAA
jgi:hypothetical protein